MTGMKSGSGGDPFEDVDDEDEEPEPETEPVPETETDQLLEEEEDEPQSSEDAADIILMQLEAIDDGELKKTIGFRHTRLKAFLAALEDSPELRNAIAEVGRSVGADLDPEDVDMSATARVLMLAGLQAEAPDAFEALSDAVDEHNSVL